MEVVRRVESGALACLVHSLIMHVISFTISSYTIIAALTKAVLAVSFLSKATSVTVRYLPVATQLDVEGLRCSALTAQCSTFCGVYALRPLVP